MGAKQSFRESVANKDMGKKTGRVPAPVKLGYHRASEVSIGKELASSYFRIRLEK